MQMTFDKFRAALPDGVVGKVQVASVEGDCTQCRDAILPGDIVLLVRGEWLCQLCAMGRERE